MTDTPFTSIDVHLKHVVFSDLAEAAQKAILVLAVWGRAVPLWPAPLRQRDLTC